MDRSHRRRSHRHGIAAVVMAAAGVALSVTLVSSQSGSPIDRHFALARSAVSGERALATVAFMDRHWRLPGNEGFDASIRQVEQILLEGGYRSEETPGSHPFTYRIESRPLRGPAWDPVAAELRIAGEPLPLLRFETNRNMIAINSHATPAGGVEAPLVYVGRGQASDFEGKEVAGAIVMGDSSPGRLVQAAVQERDALGVLSWSMPAYNRPEVHRNSIQFSSIRYDAERRTWALRLSYAARERLLEALEGGSVRVSVSIETRFYESEELTLVAEARGRRAPEERLVFSAHVQEPGANDNASGVAAQAEMARALAQLVREGMPLPNRTITFIWGDEISSTRRYIEEDAGRASGIRWGISLDMVGENTALTGGTFLIEKMPDPSAVWTRGADRHTEWGGRPLRSDQLFPHYLNDFVLQRCLEQGRHADWVVETNPYEGGSDHVPFLRADIPGLLLWHFTDEFYHTDGDRPDKVSAATMQNVAVSALASALALTSGESAVAHQVVEEIERAALERLEREYLLSRTELGQGGDRELQRQILRAWTDWYVKAAGTADDIEIGGPDIGVLRRIEEAQARITALGEELIRRLG